MRSASLDVDGGDGDGVADLHAGVRASVRVVDGRILLGRPRRRPHLRDRGARSPRISTVSPLRRPSRFREDSGSRAMPRPASRFSAARTVSRRPAVSFIRSVPATRPLPLPAIGALALPQSPRSVRRRPQPLTPAEPVDGYATDRAPARRRGPRRRRRPPAVPRLQRLRPSARRQRDRALAGRDRSPAVPGRPLGSLPHPRRRPRRLRALLRRVRGRRRPLRGTLPRLRRPARPRLLPLARPRAVARRRRRRADAVDFVAYERGSTPDTGT